MSSQMQDHWRHQGRAVGSAGKKKMIRNDRFRAVPKCSNIFEKVKSVSDLPDNIFNELEQFFIDYNKMEGKEFKAIKKMGPKEAGSLIEA